eukprot:CAMPEP_0196997674 /NCGR_PEP_ID=MMETSP1380-20130617/3224_1 /TAXON_ID=5936 /ORGANISM="Euplotes crassus, Strain CT5" /LENGTH=212 /DNA_ID=CAMNT_0042413977 /DNA_START=17 /DNA_END=655 /DNA_ORIENTATION=+
MEFAYPASIAHYGQGRFDSEFMASQEQVMPQTSLDRLAQTYCLCNLGSPQEAIYTPSAPYGFACAQKISGEFSLPMTDPELRNCSIDPESMTKEEIYFELLKGYEYKTITYFDHKKQREVPLYQCGVQGCGKVLQKPWNLLDHVRMHAGVKPYICTWCGKGFTQKGNLKKHMRQHIKPDVNDRKRYNCRFCSKGYTERYNLKAHMNKCHPEQ